MERSRTPGRTKGGRVRRGLKDLMAQRMTWLARILADLRRLTGRLRALGDPAESAPRTVRSGESGTAAIEFALMAPYLLVLMGGVVEFGLAMYECMQVNAAVEAGIVSAVVNGWNSDAIVSAVAGASQLPSAYSVYNDGVTATPAPSYYCGCAIGAPTYSVSQGTGTPPSCSCSGSGAPGAYVQVSATIGHLPLFPTSFGLPKTFHATAVIRI